MAKFDFSTSEDYGSPLDISGWFPATVEAAEETTSKASGNLMFKITLALAGVDAVVYDYAMLTGKSARWNAKKIKAILGNTEDLVDGEEIHASDLMARRCWVKIHMEESTYQGKKYNNPRVDVSGGECGYHSESYCAWPESGEFDPADKDFTDKFGEASEGFDGEDSIPF
jgi:hypothetical protein